MWFKRAFLVVPILFIVFGLVAQNKRPKVGLVLSGGGAKGVAHIGVLKAMEEAGLTPDYITGTSMGSIMGGLYSIGYSADEIKAIVESVNWDQVLTNKIPLDKVTFEEKDYYGRYLLDFYLKDKQLQFPSGVIEGQALMELFSKVTRPVHEIDDFSKFPIPFACVGANIVTGEPVVLNKGSLATAMRASMAIPTFFTPVKVDGKLLVDGGLVRNMPVPEVLEMGADIVIGVYVGTDLQPEENLKSLVSILTQSAFITNAFDTREQLKKCDILIQPDIKGYSTASFQSTSAIMEIGMEIGKKYVETFRHLADSLKQFGPLHKVVKPAIQDTYTFEKIEIEGNNVISNDFIVGKLQFIPGSKLSVDEVEKKINFLYGSQYFEKIQYQITGEPGKRTLKISVVEKPKTHFRFSYYYDTENKGGIIGNVTLRNVLLNSSRLIFEAKMAVQPNLMADYLKYLGKKQNFAAGLSGIFSKNDLPFYDSTGVVTNVYGSTFSGGALKLQSTRVQSSTFGVELKWTAMKLTGKINEESLRRINRINYSNTSFVAFYRFNNQNDRYFPTRGLIANVEFSATPKTKGKIYIDNKPYDAELLGDILQTSTIKAMRLNLVPVFKLSPKVSLLTKARLSLSNVRKNTLNITEYDFIGGFTPDLVNSNEYYGSGIKQYDVANYFYGRLGLQYEMIRNLFLQTHFNVLSTEFPVDMLYSKGETDMLGTRRTRFGIAGKVGLKSPVGPVSFALAKDLHMHGWKAALIIGFTY